MQRRRDEPAADCGVGVGLGGGARSGWVRREQETGRTNRLEKGQGEKKNWEGTREGPCVVLNVSSVVVSNCEQMFGHCGVEHLECLQPRSTQLENSFAAGSTWVCTHAGVKS